MRRPRAGFSALEIMTALTLATIGGAVLSVSMERARSIARNASCESNIKQLSIAMHMYATDNAWLMPPRYDAFGAIMPYMKNEQVLLCPQAPKKASEEPGMATPLGHGPQDGKTDAGPERHYATDYIMRPLVQTDDLPGLVVIGDDSPDRHPGRRWIGARLDGAAFLWPADQWESRLGWVMRNDATKRP